MSEVQKGDYIRSAAQDGETCKLGILRRKNGLEFLAVSIAER
jgi:hypothetical protein